MTFRERFCERCNGTASIVDMCRGMSGWRRDMVKRFPDLSVPDFDCPAGLAIGPEISPPPHVRRSDIKDLRGCEGCRERALRKMQREMRDA
jgi:hypothetical protein